MRTIFYILGLLLFLSCKEKPIPKQSDYIFQLPQKEIFVKTSKLQGGNFIISFAYDSLLLANAKDSIKYRTGFHPQIIVDTTGIYINSQYKGTRLISVENSKYKFKDTTDSISYRNSGILSIGIHNFNIKVISDSVFSDTFFRNNIQIYPYSFISIDTDEYKISVDGEIIKKGYIYGGW